MVSNSAGSVASASEMLAVSTTPTAPTKIASAIAVFAQVRTPFQYTIASSGGTAPISYNASPLPAGLSMDPVSGQISGIPAETVVELLERARWVIFGADQVEFNAGRTDARLHIGDAEDHHLVTAPTKSLRQRGHRIDVTRSGETECSQSSHGAASSGFSFRS